MADDGTIAHIGHRGVIMAGFLDDRQISIPCGNCGHKTKKSIAWIKRNHEFTCKCGTQITLKAGQFTSEIAKAEKALADFQRTLRGFGK
jgi:hypothetical protein